MGVAAAICPDDSGPGRNRLGAAHGSRQLQNYKQHFIGYLIPAVVFGSLAVMIDAIRKRQDVAKEKLAFGASAVYLVGRLVGAAFALYSAVLPASSDRALNLTIYNTAAGHHGLTVCVMRTHEFTLWHFLQYSRCPSSQRGHSFRLLPSHRRSQAVNQRTCA
jgi:cytochrome bd-type quinol oxidase subunit 2